MRKRQRAIKLFHNKTFVEKKYKTDRNSLKDGDNDCEYEPSMVFDEVGVSRWKCWRAKRRLVLFVDGATKALNFGKTTEEMKPFNTQGDLKKLVRREMKKSLAEHKPMKWSQFILLMIPIVVILLLLLNLTFGGGGRPV